MRDLALTDLVAFSGIAAAIEELACRSSIAAADREAYVNFIFGFGKGYGIDVGVEKFVCERCDEILFGGVAVFAQAEELLVGG